MQDGEREGERSGGGAGGGKIGRQRAGGEIVRVGVTIEVGRETPEDAGVFGRFVEEGRSEEAKDTGC